MASVKVKVEKPDSEASAARYKLDVVLQGLVDKSDVDSSSNSKDLGDGQKALVETNKGTRFPHQKRKRRKDAEEFLIESTQPRKNAYVRTFFDRSVDLAQFSENSPLYPICRAWMRNQPNSRDDLPGCPDAELESSDNEVPELLNGKCSDVYRLPPPKGPRAAGVQLPPCIPSGILQLDKYLDTKLEETPTKRFLLTSHMEHWKKVRQKWREASQGNQARYVESTQMLKSMFERP
uniref:protein lin-37 homolog isoform X2 n=1 Tax=Myxine glutinosa TaxID=7769 RepID=UPI00358E82C5